MRWKKLSQKSRDILGAIAKGDSCKQILADDPTLTYHDIFHAAAESPTTCVKKEQATRPAFRERKSKE
ncbi:MAG TPA: hypothetical protein VNZ64_17385 [Candidatus Acidoferrum sp.]|jgi:hypothetical protein|nr:hypothetical protein [Candidatus Acidoferrum sp.]